MGVERGGNARAEGCAEPQVRMSNTFVTPGDAAPDEMLSELGDGLYLVGSRGGEVSPAEGIFHFNAEYGYLIKGGELSEMVRDVSIAGSTRDTMKTIEMVGSDLRLSAGMCGKGGQSVPVSDGSPHLLLSALVGGS